MNVRKKIDASKTIEHNASEKIDQNASKTIEQNVSKTIKSGAARQLIICINTYLNPILTPSLTTAFGIKNS